MRSCPNCSSNLLVSRGTERHAALVVEGGRLVEVEGVSQRLTCKACGKTSTHRDGALSEASHEAHALIVDTTHRLGQTAASAELGIPRTTIQRHMARWRDAREPEVRRAAPSFLLVETASLRGAERVLVVDLDRESLIEMLQAPGDLREWIDDPDRAPAVKVCMGIDARLSGIVRECLPGAEVMVAPSTMRRAVRMEAILSTRAVRRAPETRGRNGMPFPQEMARVLREGGPAPDEWPSIACAVLSASRAALDLLASPTRDRAERAWPQFDMAARLAPVQRLSRLFSTWREPILAGIDHRFVDGPTTLVSRARRALVTRQPRLGFQDLRGYALMDGFQSVVEGLPIPGVPQVPISVGKPLRELLADLG